jgi:hypothetical protein
MAKAARQAVTIHYRRLEEATNAFGTQTLEAAIRAAMNCQIGGAFWN